MKPDSLEAELVRQPFQPLPPAWRDEILAAAAAAATPGWRDYLWPHPRAWAALAAGWVAIAGFLLAGRLATGGMRVSEAEQALTRAWSAPHFLQASFNPATLPPAPRPRPAKAPGKPGQSWVLRPLPMTV
jgi:hypothetical protein